MNLESPEFTRLRISASNAVDAGFSILEKRANEAFSSEFPFSLSRSLDSVDSCCFDAVPGVERLFDHYSNQAFVHGYKKGFNDVGGDSILSVYIENGIWDITKRATEKAKSLSKKLGEKTKQKVKSAGSAIRDSLVKAFKKLFPRSKSKKEYSPEEIKAIQALAKKVIREELNKLDKETKQLLQDEITSSAAEGKLTAYEDAGAKSVKVRIDTVKDERRCKKCAELEGKIVPIEQAKSLLPRHPRCRCMWNFVSDKYVTKQLRLEHKEQERKVTKLRDRLDKKYRQKQAERGTSTTITNASCLDSVSDLSSVPSPVYNIAIDLDSHPLPYYLTLKSLRFRKGETGVKLSCSDDAFVDGRLIPGSVLKLLGKYGKDLYFECIGNLYGDDGAKWGKDNSVYIANSVSLYPESLSEYPYELVSSSSEKIKAIMLNPYCGYLEINGRMGETMETEDLITLSTNLRSTL